MSKKIRKFKAAEIVMLVFLGVRVLAAFGYAFSRFSKYFFIGIFLSLFYIFAFYSVWKRKEYALKIVVAVIVVSVLSAIISGSSASFVGGIILIMLAAWYAKETKNV